VQAYLLQLEDIKLPSLKRKRHKYEAGSVIAWCGSPGMEGAASLSTLATLKVGAGIVKLFCRKKIMLHAMEVLQISFETALKSVKKAQTFMAGPGIGRGLLSKLIWKCFRKRIDAPCVLDADALYLTSLAELSKMKHPVVITPHRKECLDFLRINSEISDESLIEKIQQNIGPSSLYLVLKGVPTWIFHHGQRPIVFYGGDPGMATAGAGDVLTGMIAGLISQKMKPIEAIEAAVYIHGMTGELAAEELTSYSVMASSLLKFLPRAIQLMQKQGIR
jgi:NAD(P)H-hydrate epimerase